MKARVAESVNPELCRITEDLVFTEPYIDVERNSFVDELRPEVEALRADTTLRAEVGMLKWAFMTQAEILVHGDLHTGSVMVRTRDGVAECRVIDPEFGYYGPTGFDLGLFGNFLVARARAVVVGDPLSSRTGSPVRVRPCGTGSRPRSGASGQTASTPRGPTGCSTSGWRRSRST